MPKNLVLSGFEEFLEKEREERMIEVCTSTGFNSDFSERTDDWKQIPLIVEKAISNSRLSNYKLFFVKLLWNKEIRLWISVSITNQLGAVEYLQNK